MSDIQWPSDDPEAEGYMPNPSQNFSGSTLPSKIVTQMDSGRRRVRRRFGDNDKIFQVSWLFNAQEFENFETFFRDTLDAGTKWFTLPLPLGDALVSTPVRFLEGYAHSHQPVNHWAVTATLEQRLAQTVTAPEIDIMPLLLQDVLTFTDDVTLSMSHQNKLLRCNPGVGETIFVTLPLNANFTTAFSCGVTNIGLGSVQFVGEGGVVFESVNGYTRIFQRYTPVTVAYVGTNVFQGMGSLY